MSKAASALGKKGKGVPKNLSAEEIERRTKQLAKAREKRWPKKKPKVGRAVTKRSRAVHRTEHVPEYEENHDPAERQ